MTLVEIGMNDPLSFRDCPIATEETTRLPHVVDLKQRQLVLQKKMIYVTALHSHEQTYGIQITGIECSPVLEHFVQAFLDGREFVGLAQIDQSLDSAYMIPYSPLALIPPTLVRLRTAADK